MAINDNSINLSQHKGEIRRCPLCTRQSPDAALDALTSGKACKLCFGQGFVSMCKNCDGTGQFKGRTIWDGGRSEHVSVCSPCGGTGAFATKKPADWVDHPPVDAPKVVEPVASTV